MAAHRLVEHVGEVELELDGATEPDVFVEAATAFRELVGGVPAHGRPLRKRVALVPGDDARLLADWLDELVYLAEVERFVPLRVPEIDVRDGNLVAVVEGVRGRPRHLVKGATLHGLALRRKEDGWHGRVVLDV